MIAVLFEAIPAEGKRDDYLSLAAQLKGQLTHSEGFISIERFESLAEPGKILSLSFWQDEESVARWRRQAEHREAQEKGRASIFVFYRLRVAAVLRDYDKANRDQAPHDSRHFHSKKN